MGMVKVKRWLLGLGMIGALLVVSGAAVALQPRITWNPNPLVTESIAPGESATYSVILTETGLLPILATNQLRIVAEGAVAPYVTIEQPDFPRLFKRGDMVTFTVTVSVPENAPVGVSDGALLLKRFIGNREVDVWRAEALPMSMTITPPLSVQWTPPSLTIVTASLEDTTTNATFVPSADATNIAVSVTPELVPFVMVSPATYGSIAAGETHNVSLTLTTSANAEVGTYSGVIQLRSGDGKHSYPGVLPIELNLGTPFRDDKHKFLIYYPSNFDSLASRVNQPALLAHNDFLSPSGALVVSVSVYQNETRVPIADWYQETLSDKEYAYADSRTRITTSVVIAGLPSLRVQSDMMGFTMIRTYIPNGEFVIGVDMSVPDNEPVPRLYFEMLKTLTPL